MMLLYVQALKKVKRLLLDHCCSLAVRKGWPWGYRAAEEPGEHDVERARTLSTNWHRLDAWISSRAMG